MIPKISSIAVKSAIARTAHHLGMISSMIKRNCDQHLILTYHRIIQNSEVKEDVEPGMYVETTTFNAHIKFLKDRFHIAPLSYLSNVGPSIQNSYKPYCFLTFDDGWRDFYIHAFPILNIHQVPATLFLPTDYIGTRNWFWTDRLLYLWKRLGTRNINVRLNEVHTDPLVDRVEGLLGSRKTDLYEAIDILKGYRTEIIEKVLNQLSKRWGVDLNQSDRMFLSWEEVRRMGKSGLITYGSHSATHRLLTTLTIEEVREELNRSKEKLIKETGIMNDFLPFCYPNGSYNDLIKKMVKEAGYSLAVTTEKGWNLPSANPFCLMRIGVHQDISSNEALFGCRICGIL